MVRGHVAVPARQQPDGRKLDFNDLAIAEGHEAVAAIIVGAFPEAELEPEPASSEPEPSADSWKQRLARCRRRSEPNLLRRGNGRQREGGEHGP